MSDTCLICIENYGLGRRAIKCKYCNYQACEKCVCNYLLVRNEDPHCMECKKEWDYEYLLLTLDKKFIDGPLKSHREDVLYDRERALLPATQVKMASDKLAKARIEELKKIKRQMEEEFYSKIRAIDNEITELKGGKKRFNQVFIRKCPLDGCRGFLSHTWVCGLCEKSICSKCYNLKNDDHECKPDELETARLIINETKPCPKCSTLIYKIDGCDQMWCTNCKTGFSWRTGQIALKIHNPHYYEWVRNGGRIEREIGDLDCGGIPEFMTLLDAFNRVNLDRNISMVKDLYNRHRQLIHNQDTLLPKYNYTFNESTNEDLRIKFLSTNYSEKQFKKTLQTREKTRNKKKAVYHLIEMYINTSSDLFRNLITSLNNLEPPSPDAEDEFEWANVYDCLTRITADFKNLDQYVRNQCAKINMEYGGMSVVIV